MAIRVRRSAGNVFADLGFAPQKAGHLRMRADLMLQLTKLLLRRKLTQAQSAHMLGVSQPRVSDLTRGKIDRFSIDTLVEMLERAGMRVSFVTKRGRRVA